MFQLLLNVILFSAIFLFLLHYFEPFLLFLKTTISGGDTGSHYYTAVYLKENLIPKGKIMGWLSANYAGFPLFYHYFPLPFLLMVILSYVIPLEIAFKLVTFFSVLILPYSVFLMFKLLGYSNFISVIGALFGLIFLFHEGNSMWGGNIPSMLAGEFSFSLSLAFFTIMFGSLYAGIKTKRFLILNAILLALILFSHGYTFLMISSIALFYLISTTWKENFYYIFKVFLLGVLLVSFWFIPFLFNLPWTTPFRFKWHFANLWEILPPSLIPLFILSLIALILMHRDKRIWLFMWALGASLIGYLVAYNVGLGDIRFLTFTQYFLSIMGAILASKLERKIEHKPVFVLVTLIFLIILSFLWIKVKTKYIKDWIRWNYSGFEAKADWPRIKELFDFLREMPGAERVVYEHSTSYEKFGTIRIFESLKFFAGKDTLEGLYLQSSITAPFVFYIQSEISKEISAPLWDYPVGTFNLDMGARHLSLFNVGWIIATSDLLRGELRSRPEIISVKNIGDIELFRFNNPDPGYVVPLKYEPIAYVGKNWKRDFYEWFKMPEAIEVIFVKIEDKEDLKYFKMMRDKIEDIQKVSILKDMTPPIQSIYRDDIIEFETPYIGHPHLIRVSYHPNWKVEGAEKVFLASPSFMLVFPEKNRVRLVFKDSYPEHIGKLCTIIALILIVGSIAIKRGMVKSQRGSFLNLYFRKSSKSL